MAQDIASQLANLALARRLVLGEPAHYPTIIPSLLPVINGSAHVELRRWGADFLAETFASPLIAPGTKETMAVTVLGLLKELIEDEAQDPHVVKSVVQVAASIYPAVIRWIIRNSYDTTSWNLLLAIKSRIFRLWDTASGGVRLCCVKFAQKMVITQSPGSESNLQRGRGDDLSLSNIPADHPLLIPRNLEAEASGLLDRMLAVFHENSSDAVLVDATLNSLSILIRQRPKFSNKILSVILNFNPLKLANSPMTPKTRVMVKSMEKTTRMLLVHILKRDMQHPLAQKIHHYVERMARSKADIFDETNRKRGPPESGDALDAAKRQKLSAPVATPIKVHVPPLSAGPHTLAEVFTVTPEEALRTFDVGQLPEDLVVKIGVTLLQRINATVLEQTINGIRSRYTSMQAVKPEDLNPDTAILGVDDDEDDDYEPDFHPSAEDTEQILNKLDKEPPEESLAVAPVVSLGPFIISAPLPLTPEQTSIVSASTAARVFSTMTSLGEPGPRKSGAGINRLAASTYDRDAWITLMTRLASRSAMGLDTSAQVKSELQISAPASMGSSIRETLYVYILEDFRRRIDVAVAWLCEEWYNDRIALKIGTACHVPQYDTWLMRIMDGILPYLDAKDKILTRFLSEVPALDKAVLGRVKQLCQDPAMVTLALTSLLYLVMMRPPARDMALDTVEEIWRDYEDARPMAAKYLTKWRPDFQDRLAPKKEEDEITMTNNGALS